MKYLSSLRVRRDSGAGRGFTLAEIMVVIAVLGILVAIVTANFNQARMQARDKVRQAQLQQLQVAIEQYKDKYGRYPALGCGASGFGGSNPTWSGSGTFTSAAPHTVTCPGAYIQALAPDFIENLPLDPLSRENTGYIYMVNSGRTSYKLMAGNSVETLLITEYSQALARYPSTACGLGATFPANSQTYYAVYSGGAECW